MIKPRDSLIPAYLIEEDSRVVVTTNKHVNELGFVIDVVTVEYKDHVKVATGLVVNREQAKLSDLQTCAPTDYRRQVCVPDQLSV